MSYNKILVDCERMKYPNTGLYHFCLQLGLALTQQLNNHIEHLDFYVRKNEIGIFGSQVGYISQHSLHKYLMPKTKGIDIWHSTYQSTQYFPIRKNMKMVLTIHDLNFLYEPNKTKQKQQKYIKDIQHKIDNAAHIVCISQFVLNDVTTHLNISDKPISVIYNGCNINSKNSLNNIQPTITLTGKFLFTIGTIVDKKNFHVLPALLVNNDYNLIIAGITQSEKYKNQIIVEANKLNVANRILFVGEISENDKNWYYKNCEAFLFPSISEGFGLPVIEAMYHGKPLFLSTRTSLPEIGGEHAYYFNDFLPENMQYILEKGLEHYHSNPYIKDALKQRAYMFNWANTAKQYMEIYRSLY